MRPNITVTADNFLVFTKPDDFADPKARSIATTHAAKFASKNSYKLTQVWYGKPDRSVIRWRPSPASHAPQVRAGTKHRKKAARCQSSQTAASRINEDIPTSIPARPSLQHFFQANPVFYYPAQIMLEAGSPATVVLFPTIDFNGVYHAVVGMLLGWLATQFPTQYPLSAVLFHQAQAISMLRQRLSQGVYNEETYLSILCAMQTAALLGDRKALLAHERGLEELDCAMATPLSEYCRSMKPRHNALVKEAIGGWPAASPKHHEPHLYPISIAPVDAGILLSALPPGIREMMSEHNVFDKKILQHWAAYFTRLNRVLSNETSTPTNYDFDFELPIHVLMDELRNRILEDNRTILDRHDQPAAAAAQQLISFVHTANYLYFSTKYYRLIMQRSPTFLAFRRQATAFINRYQPRNLCDRNLLLHSAFLTIHSWKTGTVLEREGVLLVESLKRRFPDVQDWVVLRHIMKAKFGHLDPVLAEWEHSWSQSALPLSCSS